MNSYTFRPHDAPEPEDFMYDRHKNGNDVMIIRNEMENSQDGATYLRVRSGFYEFECPKCFELRWTNMPKRRLKGCLDCFPEQDVEDKTKRVKFGVGWQLGKLMITDEFKKLNEVECVCECGELFRTKVYRLRLKQIHGCRKCCPEDWLTERIKRTSDEREEPIRALMTHLSQTTHKQFRLACLEKGVSMGKVVRDLIAEWLSGQSA